MTASSSPTRSTPRPPPERITSEQAYYQAVDDEVEYGGDAVGQLMRRGQRGDNRWRPSSN